MKPPSDAQAAFLSLIAEHEAEGRTVEWQMPDDETAQYMPSRAHLHVEVVDREAGRSRFVPADDGGYRHRVATVEACLRAGWVDGLHERHLTWPATRYTHRERVWHLRQLDMTEDGVIALGLWQTRKLAAAPPPLPTLTDREREVVALAQRALDLGYALCARKPAREEVRRMRKEGWLQRGGAWVANNAQGLVPTSVAVVEALPDRADDAALVGDGAFA